jgi:hypothetical protein
MNDDLFAVIRQSALRDTLPALLGAVIILLLGIAVHDVRRCAVSTGSDGTTTSDRAKFSLGATAHS